MSHPTVGCFGKIPIHGDFVRHRIPPTEIDQIDRWLQGGIFLAQRALGSAWKPSYEATPPQRFLFQPPRADRILAGIFTASQDRTGRLFPFMVFTVIDPALVEGELSLLPLHLAEFLDRAHALATRAWRDRELHDFLVEVDAVSVEASLEETRQRYRDFAADGDDGAPGSGTPGDDRRCLLVFNLSEVLRSGTTPRYVLRIPQAAAEAGVASWLELTRRLGRRARLPTWTCWGPGRGDAPPGVTMVLDDLLAKYFLPVLCPERKDDLLYPLTENGRVPEARLHKARERYGALLKDEALGLAALLRKMAEA